MKVESEAELSQAIISASDPLQIIGGGTRGFLAVDESDILSVSPLSGVTLYQPGALTLVVKAGTPLAEVEALLAANGQHLPFEPMDHRKLLSRDGTPTIGGAVAANVSGPRRIQAGACRDYLLGVRFVDGSGRILKNGGRVMKNVTGYDLVKLMAGSFGTLGVLTELSLKVLPKPECSSTLAIDGLSDRRAVQALSSALGSPFDVTAAAHLPATANNTARTLIRLEGFDGSVRYRAAKVQAMLADFGVAEIEMDAAQNARIWHGIRDSGQFHGCAGDVWRISVKPSDGPSAASLLNPHDAKVMYDWGGGLLTVLVPVGCDVRAILKDMNGHARIVRASAETKQRLGVFPSNGAVLDQLAAGLRAKFDPRNIFNPGLMGH